MEAVERKAGGVYPRQARRGSQASASSAWLPSLVFLPAVLYVVFGRGEVLGIDQLNVLVHEAGHLLFFALGDLWHAAGGTLMQMLLPAFLTWHFWHGGLPFGVQLSLFWLGHNALDVSIYAADARAQAFLLAPGRKHDWAHLLGQLDLLAYDALVAYFFCFTAMVCFLLAMLVPYAFARKRLGAGELAT